MADLSKFNIDIEKDGIENATIYSLVCVFSMVEKRIIDYLKDYNLSPSQFNALMIIKHVGKDKGLSQIDIGERLIVSPSNMTRLLDKLSKEKLLERYAQEHDRRVNLIKITQKGSDLLDKAWPGYDKLVKELTSSMTEEEMKQITSQMLKWFDRLSV